MVHVYQEYMIIKSCTVHDNLCCMAALGVSSHAHSYAIVQDVHMAVACQFEDQRGVPRGSCRECDCHLFQRGQHQACARCNHPPAKHEKMLAQSPSPLRYSEVVSCKFA